MHVVNSFDLGSFPPAETTKLVAAVLDMLTNPASAAHHQPLLPATPTVTANGISTPSSASGGAGGGSSGTMAAASGGFSAPFSSFPPPRPTEALTPFHARSIPSIDLAAYLA